MKEFDIISIEVEYGGIATMKEPGWGSTELGLPSLKKTIGWYLCQQRCVPKRLCGMVHKLQKLFAIMAQTMDLLLNKQDLFAILRKSRSYIDRSRNSYGGSFKRNG